MAKVLIPEKIPAHNKGEEAIARGILKTLDFTDIEKIYLYSRSPEYDRKIYGDPFEIIENSLIPDPEKPKRTKIARILKSLPCHAAFAIVYALHKGTARRIFRGTLWRVYDETDFILAAHDSAYAIMHNVLILFARMIGKPVIIYGTSILPFLYEKRWVRALTRACMNKADLVTAREKITYDILKDKIGIKKEIIRLTADKAFLLDPIDKGRAKGILAGYGIRAGKDIVIGVTAVYKTGIFNTLRYDVDAHIRVFASFIDSIIGLLDCTVVFFPHSIGPKEKDDDRTAARLIRETCARKEKIVCITDDFFSGELKGMIGCCDFFIGERTHSVIAAISMSVPAISLSHPADYRTIGILGEAAGLADRIYNVENLEAHSLFAFFRKAWGDRQKLREHLAKTQPVLAKNAMANREHLIEALRRRKAL